MRLPTSWSEFASRGRALRLALLSMLLVACASSPPPSGSGDAGTPAERLQAHLELAEGYLEAGELARARRPLERAREIDPRAWQVHRLQARIHQLEGDAELATEAFRQALRYADGEARVHNDYGVFLYQQGRYEDAVEQLRKAVSDPSNPQRAVAYENLGLASLQVGARTDARNAFHRAIMLREAMPRSLLELAEMALEESDYQQAASYYDRFERMSRQTPRSLWIGIRLARALGRADDEASYALQLRNLYPHSDEFMRYQESLRDG